MSERPLRDFRTVTLNGSGTGTVSFGPQRANTFWTINSISVTVSSNVAEPTASIYRGTPNVGSLVTATYSGSQDTDSNVNDNPLYPGEVYSCQWTNGDPSATATVSFTGVESSYGV
jgi:hypothetical protein